MLLQTWTQTSVRVLFASGQSVVQDSLLWAFFGKHPWNTKWTCQNISHDHFWDLLGWFRYVYELANQLEPVRSLAWILGVPSLRYTSTKKYFMVYNICYNIMIKLYLRMTIKTDRFTILICQDDKHLRVPESPCRFCCSICSSSSSTSGRCWVQACNAGIQTTEQIWIVKPENQSNQMKSVSKDFKFPRLKSNDSNPHSFMAGQPTPPNVPPPEMWFTSP